MTSDHRDEKTCNSKQRRDSSRYSVLCFEQVERLYNFMEQEIAIHGLGGCPPVRLTLKDWVQRVRTRLEADGVPVRDVRLNGGGASYIIGMDPYHTYNDLDLLFGVDLSSRDTVDIIRRAVLECLHSFLIEQQRDADEKTEETSSETEQDAQAKRPLPQQLQMVEAYVSKQARIEHADRWFLLSLGSQDGLTVELKFVDHMRRQFEFTVDSFQIILDSLITFYKVQPSSSSISERFYPTVVAEAASGCFEEAFGHLRRREICTRCPEQIRGGGLLKYCKLLVDGYLPAQGLDVPHLEKYMCSRFFIDFPDARQQRVKIQSYLAAHFPPADAQLRTLYLQILADVVCNSTVCLMQQERRSALYLISELLSQTYFEAEAAAAAAAAAAATSTGVALEPFNSADWVIDQVFYGTQLFPSVSCLGSIAGTVYTTTSAGCSTTTPPLVTACQLTASE
ncbi:hypothetical protein BOX15_Mlig025932g1 [Macrostomum lignano]|uniref:polynucleotide adenylyltransferase n=2 Tax=Macrostomum lignano TaxID=282301 RepID=A0A1I8HE16_9PLAT|nr:hypothetical protein BOX15_Mlig025932g1 [Macrostomum lignano]